MEEKKPMKQVMLHLSQLESEAIFIIRETVAELEKPVLLFSGGKDSIVVLHLAKKSFWPAKIPFPLMHIDTGHNFDETIKFRDDFIQKYELELIVKKVEDSIKQGRVKEEKGANASRNILQTTTLLDALEEYNFDGAFGGARRDEEKARAKERFLSHRDDFGQWDPKNQRPELWDLLNFEKHIGEHFRIFPISNWTEMDVWQYIKQENLEIPSIYFSHSRKVLSRNNVYLAKSPYIMLKKNETYIDKIVRFRTVGDMTCTGAIESKANNIDDIIYEVATSKITERGGRADDKRTESAMEERKKLGYF